MLDHVGGAACAGAMDFLRLREDLTVAAHCHAFLLVKEERGALACGPDVCLHGVFNLVGLLPLSECCDWDVSPGSSPEFGLQDHRTGQADVLLNVDLLRLVQHGGLNLEPIVPVLVAGVALRASGVSTADSFLNDTVLRVDPLISGHDVVRLVQLVRFIVLLRGGLLRVGRLD